MLKFFSRIFRNAVFVASSSASLKVLLNSNFQIVLNWTEILINKSVTKGNSYKTDAQSNILISFVLWRILQNISLNLNVYVS